jgi:hypothetical protein
VIRLFNSAKFGSVVFSLYREPILRCGATRLSSLQTVDISGCGQLSGHLSPLAGLTSLQTLYLCGCTGVRKFAPLEALLPRLRELQLYRCRFDDLPTEVCGQYFYQNVIHEVRSLCRSAIRAVAAGLPRSDGRAIPSVTFMPMRPCAERALVPLGCVWRHGKWARSRNGMRKLRTGDSARERRSGRQLIAGCRNNAMSTFQQNPLENQHRLSRPEDLFGFHVGARRIAAPSPAG